jgi:hypothetical protein
MAFLEISGSHCLFRIQEIFLFMEKSIPCLNKLICLGFFCRRIKRFDLKTLDLIQRIVMREVFACEEMPNGYLAG